jgi:hypothetical protein
VQRRIKIGASRYRKRAGQKKRKQQAVDRIKGESMFIFFPVEDEKPVKKSGARYRGEKDLFRE